MSIRSRITLWFTGIVALLILAFCVIIYYEAEYHRQREYKSRLRQETATAAAMYFSKSEISPELFNSLIQKERTVLQNEEFRLYKENKVLIYESGTLESEIAHQVLDELEKKPEVFMDHDERQVFGRAYELGGEDYLVITSAFDKYGLSKQSNLALILIIGGIGTIALSFLGGWLLAGRFLRPIQKIISGIDKIKGSQLSLRLDEGNKKDELGQLSIRFNQMLNRLEKAFAMEKAFVSHASHELRTPLTAITGQIQVSLLAQDNTESLKEMITSVLEDVQQLNKLTNNLLDLTSVNASETLLDKKLINIPEVIWNARSAILLKNANYQVQVEIEDNDDYLPEINGNESLLFTSFVNLIDNGAKFSPENKVTVNVSQSESEVQIIVQNNGPIIPESELQHIFEPFRRGSNAHQVKGHGVGLALTQRIVKMHGGKILLSSTENKGTVVTIVFSSH